MRRVRKDRFAVSVILDRKSAMARGSHFITIPTCFEILAVLTEEVPIHLVVSVHY